MKILIMLSFFSLFSKAPESGIVEVKDFGSNPGNLTMYQYIPDNVSEKPPLVVVLHGCLQCADTIATQSGWNKLAYENNFIVIYPQQKIANNFNKCFNWYQLCDNQRDSGEAASIKQMVDYAVKNYNVNSEKVFITGISGGGAMSSAMLANYPETFNAGAVMAGVPYGVTTDLKSALSVMKGEVLKGGKEWADLVVAQNPDFKGNYPRLAVIHGVDDPYVNIVNAEEIVKQYASLHNINGEPEITDGFEGNSDVIEKKYMDANNEEKIVLYSIKNMGHGVAIDPGTGKKQGGETSRFSIDKNFHSSYWIARFFGITD